MRSQWLNFSGRKGQFPPPNPEGGILSLISPLWFFSFPGRGVGKAGSSGKVSALPPPPPPRRRLRAPGVGMVGALEAALPLPGFPGSPRSGGSPGVRLLRCARPRAGSPRAPRVAFAGRSVTKSRLGGGEGRPRRWLLRPPTPHEKRNNLFILGFKNPSLLPALRSRPTPPPSPPSSARSCPVPPAAPSSSPSSSLSPSSSSSPPPWDPAFGEEGGALSAFSPAPPGDRRLGGALRPRPPARVGPGVGEGASRFTNRKPKTTDTL